MAILVYYTEWDNFDQYVTLNCHNIPIQYNCDQYVTLKLQPVPDYLYLKAWTILLL
jgi:hypothetical protein